MKIKFNLIKCVLFSSIFLYSNCEKIHKGYKLDDDISIEMIKMVDKKITINDFVNKFGSPTFINAPINDTLCYVYAHSKQIAFNRFYKPTYQYMCIKFKNNISDSYETKSITKIKKQKMAKFDTKLTKPL